jgi:hypothetical protein
MIDRLKVEQCVESLCQNGCAAVNATITAMQKDLDNISLPGLQKDEKKMVLKELQDIMSVYDRPCEIKQQAAR